ncbi:MAG: ATP-binding cassette domain-containing protein [Sphingomicrobium sp.]
MTPPAGPTACSPGQFATARPTRRLFDDVRGDLGKRLSTTSVLMALGALAEGAGLLTILPLLGLVTNRAAVPTWPGAGIGQGDAFVLVLALFLAALLLRAGILFARDLAMARLENDYDASLRLRAAATLAGRGWPFAAGVGQAGMQTLLANDVPRSVFALHQGLAAATALFMLVVQLAVAASLSPPMAGGALALLLLGLPSLVALSRRGRATSEAIIGEQEESAQSAYAFHGGLKAAMAQERVGEFLGAYKAILLRLRALYVGYAADMARSRARHALIAALAAVAVVGAGHLLKLELARLVALLILFARMSGPAQILQQSVVGLSAYAAAFAAIEAKLGPLAAVALREVAREPLDWTALELRGVSLSRQGCALFAPVTTAIGRGEWIALVGASGAGKTSLLDMIAGLFPPDEGQVVVDGSVLDGGVAAAWRRGLAYVGQQEMPFETTLHEALGAPATQCWEALELVGLAELVRQAPAGLSMAIADRGARLSGGERQRLLIARALLRRPSLLMLDEATAAIDVAAERRLIVALRRAYPAMTTLLVAHRAESAALCDRTLTIAP